MLKNKVWFAIDSFLGKQPAVDYRCIFCRPIHCSSYLRGAGPGLPRLVKMCRLNKTLYVHRNAEFGPQPIFYRGPRRVDLYQNYLDKQAKFKEWITFSRQVEVGESPEDDVYLTNLFKTKELKLREAISNLKDYTLLDLTDQESAVTLKLKLVEITRGKGKRKKHVTFSETKRLPHPCGHENKVGLFTANEAVVEAGLRMGLHAVGSHDIITKILTGATKCDAYFTTPEYVKELFGHSDLKMALKGQLPNKNFHVVEDVEELRPFLTDTIIQNVLDPRTCEVNIGKARQSVDELVENAIAIACFIHARAEVSKVERVIESLSVSCSTEPLLLDYYDLFPDDE